MNIANTLRQKNLDPIAICADDFYHRAVGKLGKCFVVHSCTGTDIEVAAVGGHGAGVLGFGFLRFFRFGAFGRGQLIVVVIASAGKCGNGENADAENHSQKAEKNTGFRLTHGSGPPVQK